MQESEWILIISRCISCSARCFFLHILAHTLFHFYTSNSCTFFRMQEDAWILIVSRCISCISNSCIFLHKQDVYISCIFFHMHESVWILIVSRCISCTCKIFAFYQHLILALSFTCKKVHGFWSFPDAFLAPPILTFSFTSMIFHFKHFLSHARKRMDFDRFQMYFLQCKMLSLHNHSRIFLHMQDLCIFLQI